MNKIWILNFLQFAVDVVVAVLCYRQCSEIEVRQKIYLTFYESDGDKVYLSNRLTSHEVYLQDSLNIYVNS